MTVVEIHITKLISQSCLATGKLKNSHSLNRKHNHMYTLNICFVETKYNIMYIFSNIFIDYFADGLEFVYHFLEIFWCLLHAFWLAIDGTI